jgi:tRNA threonylcarbamoyladenosine biosynthesis protein TsaE
LFVLKRYKQYNVSVYDTEKSEAMAPILDQHTLECPSHSPEQTQRLGVRLGELLRPGDLICLEGALGAGKTALAQGIGRGCGVSEPLVSPTYTLIHEYQRPHNNTLLYHIDLYRISGVQEAVGLGLDDYLDDPLAITLIEWPERAAALLPEERLWILLRHVAASKRLLQFSARGARYEHLLQQFRQRAFGV